jgi:hypothetical protein
LFFLLQSSRLSVITAQLSENKNLFLIKAAKEGKKSFLRVLLKELNCDVNTRRGTGITKRTALHLVKRLTHFRSLFFHLLTLIALFFHASPLLFLSLPRLPSEEQKMPWRFCFKLGPTFARPI